MTCSNKFWIIPLSSFLLAACGIYDSQEQLGLSAGQAEQHNQQMLFDFSMENEPIPDGWELREWDGDTPDPELISVDDTAALRLSSKRNSYALGTDLDIDITALPFLSWDWMVTVLPDKGDFRFAKSDDQAAQLIFAFSDKNVLSYIWDSNPQNRGEVGDVPISGWVKSLLGINEAKVIVIEAGDFNINKWLTEQRNLVADYKTAFGKKLPAGVVLKKMLIQINSQHTKSAAQSLWRTATLTETPLFSLPVDYSDREKEIGAPANP